MEPPKVRRNKEGWERASRYMRRRISIFNAETIISKAIREG
jgi:hypothetical protein